MPIIRNPSIWAFGAHFSIEFSIQGAGGRCPSHMFGNCEGTTWAGWKNHLPIKPAQLSHLHFKNCIKKYFASIFIVGLSLTGWQCFSLRFGSVGPNFRISEYLRALVTVYSLRSTVHDGLPVPLWARRYALHVQQVEIITTRAGTDNILSYLCNRNAMKILKELTFLQMFLGNGIRIFSSMPVCVTLTGTKNISYKHFMFESKLFLLQIQLFKFKFKSKQQRQHLFKSLVFGGLGSRKCFHLLGCYALILVKHSIEKTKDYMEYI